MTISSISTLTLGNAMLPAVTQAQAQLTNLSLESSTGQYADLGLQLGDQSGYELSLKTQNDLLQTLTDANSMATTNISTATNALDAIRTNAQTALTSLGTWTSGTNSGTTLQTLGSSSLQSLIASANTSSSGQYVFGGINSGTAPLAAYSPSPPSAAATAITQAFETTFGFAPTDPAASSISASDMQNFLSGPFAAEFSGANWSSNWSSASSTNASAQISPGQTIDVSTNANQPGFSQLAQAYTMLSVFGGAPLGASAQQAVVSAATSLVSQGMTSITATEDNLGAAQSQIAQASTSMGLQMTLLQTQIGNLDNIDPEAVATQLNTLSTQLQTAYQLTAQLQKLSLAQYIPT